MSFEVHIDWQGQTHLVGRLHGDERGASVSFEYAPEWLQRDDAFAIDPTSLPLQRDPVTVSRMAIRIAARSWGEF